MFIQRTMVKNIFLKNRFDLYNLSKFLQVIFKKCKFKCSDFLQNQLNDTFKVIKP